MTIAFTHILHLFPTRKSLVLLGHDYSIRNTWPSKDEWTKKMCYIYIHTMEFYSAIENKIMSSAATWMGLDIIILSEVNQVEENKYHMILFNM